MRREARKPGRSLGGSAAGARPPYRRIGAGSAALADALCLDHGHRAVDARAGPAVASHELDRLDLAAIAPLVAVIVALGVYPNFVTHRTEKDTTAAIQAARGVSQELAAR